MILTTFLAWAGLAFLGLVLNVAIKRTHGFSRKSLAFLALFTWFMAFLALQAFWVTLIVRFVQFLLA